MSSGHGEKLLLKSTPDTFNDLSVIFFSIFLVNFYNIDKKHFVKFQFSMSIGVCFGIIQE